MKAILLADGQQITKTHGLEQLAAKLQPRHTEFGDAEYIELCRRLTPFEVAGRYPDHALVMWSYELGILTFLDNFVLHCRQLVGRKATITNKIKDLVDEPATNSVMAAAKAALGNQNAHLDTLASR